MPQETVEKVLGRLLTDEVFRCQAKVSLERACIQYGYLLSPEEMRSIAQTDIQQLSVAAESLDGDIRRASS